MTSHYFRTARANRHVAVLVGEINMRSTTVHCLVQYSNRFDTTTATLRRIEACDGAGCDKIIKSWQVRSRWYSMHCSDVVVCLSAVTWSNKLDITVSHRLISCRASFCCCLMCWLFCIILFPTLKEFTKDEICWQFGCHPQGKRLAVESKISNSSTRNLSMQKLVDQVHLIWQLHETVLTSDKIRSTYLMINCQTTNFMICRFS